MINQTLPQWLREEIEKMRPMSPRKRWEHFWTYYKIHTLLVLGGIVLLFGFLSAQIHAGKEVLISGVFLNTDTRAEGYTYLSDGYWKHCGGNKQQRVDMIETLMIDFSKGVVADDSADRIMQVDALIAAKTLDYMILDETALEFYAPQELCMDLTQVLSPEQLERLRENIVTVYGLERKEDYAAAIDITNSAFAKKFGLTKAPTYLVVVCNAPAAENIPEFLDYLLQG